MGAVQVAGRVNAGDVPSASGKEIHTLGVINGFQREAGLNAAPEASLSGIQH